MATLATVPDLLRTAPSITDRKSFRLLWECARLALEHRIPIEQLLASVEDDYDDITALWDCFADYSRPLAHRDTILAAWERLGETGDVSLMGRLRLEPNGVNSHYLVSLDPPWLENDSMSSRFALKFGSDRFLTFYVDKPRGKHRADVLKELHAWLGREHVIAGRLWQLVYFRKRSTRSSNTPQSWEAKLFAVSGRGIEMPRLKVCSVREVVEWFIPLAKNNHTTACKMYSRLSLGFSRGYATHMFRPQQIHRVADLHDRSATRDDASVVMSDGCARIT